MAATTSELETFRSTIKVKNPEGDSHTLIILRRNQKVWLTYNGAASTTAIMGDNLVHALIANLHKALEGGSS